MEFKARNIVVLSVILLLRLQFVLLFDELFTKQFSNKKSEDASASYSNIRSAVECGSLCAQNAGCYGYSFCSPSNTCYLSSDWVDFYRTESETDCNIYKRGDAFNTGDVISLGGLNITVFPGPASKSEASAACALNGRLLQIHTVAVFRAFEGFLQSLDSTFTNLWTDGEYDSSTGTWLYSDGTPMPNAVDPSLLHSNEDNPTCVRLKMVGNGYAWHDRGCMSRFGYICELV